MIRHGLAVRIAGSHPAGPGSTPGVGSQSFYEDRKNRIFFLDVLRIEIKLRTKISTSSYHFQSIKRKNRLQNCSFVEYQMCCCNDVKSKCFRIVIQCDSISKNQNMQIIRKKVKKYLRRRWDSNPRVQSTLD